MPKSVRPPLPQGVDRAITILGNHLRTAVLISLRNEGPATRTEIARRLEVTGDNVRFHLKALELDGIVQVFPPRTDPEVRSRRYELQDEQLDELLADLARGLGAR